MVFPLLVKLPCKGFMLSPYDCVLSSNTTKSFINTYYNVNFSALSIAHQSYRGVTPVLNSLKTEVVTVKPD
jgi:hypothetical protein